MREKSASEHKESNQAGEDALPFFTRTAAAFINSLVIKAAHAGQMAFICATETKAALQA
ncbi:hypothetical protein [Erwinia amylovora]|uniref:hypothetical protein n=1 Tax=Erwinia amylovora TaxID=552 RepID=UPI001443F0C3|nr:hypothetical protein [Erwinia amylovora]